MGKTANKQMICEVLMEDSQKKITILSHSAVIPEGAGSFTPFADTYPEQFVETGIAEQNLVSIVSRTGKMRKEILCGFSGMLSFDKKL